MAGRTVTYKLEADARGFVKGIDTAGKSFSTFSTGVTATTGKLGAFSDTVGRTATTLARSADTFGLPVQALRAIDDAADVAELGLNNLSTAAAGFNAASIGVVGAGLAIGTALGNLLNQFEAVRKAADAATAPIAKLWLSILGEGGKADAGFAAGEMDKIRASYERVKAQSAALHPEVEKVSKAVATQVPHVTKAAAAVKQYSAAVEDTGRELQQTLPILKKFEGGLLAPGGGGAGQAISIEQSLDGAVDKTMEWHEALEDVSRIFENLASTGGPLSGILGAIAQITTGVAGMGAALKGFQSAGSGIGGFLQKVAGVGGMVGAGIGIIKGIGSFIGGLFGGGKKKKEEQAKKQQLLADAESQLKGLVDQWDKLRRSFVDAGASGVGSLFQNIANGAEASQERMDRLGRMGAAAFQLLRNEGLSVVEAMQQMGPTLDAALAAAEKSGTKLTGPLAELAAFRQKVTKNEDLVNAIDGLGQYISALRATGSLTQDSAQDVMAELAALQAQATTAGFTGNQALALMAPTLFQLAQAADAGTIALDAETQALVDQAESAGLFEGLQDPMAQLVEIQQQMLIVTAELAKAFGATLPASVQEYIDKLKQIPNTLPPPPGGGAPAPGGQGIREGEPTGGGGKVGEEGFASGGLVTRTGPAMLHGSPSRPEMVLNPKQTQEWLRGGGSLGSVTVNVSGAGDPRTVALEVAKVIENRTLAKIQTAVRGVR